MDSGALPNNSFDYTNIKRSPGESRKLQLLGIDLLNGENGIFHLGSIMNLNMHCLANDNVTNIGIRFEVFYADGSIVGTVFTNKTITLDKGKKIDCLIDFNLKNLATGRYYAVALAYEFNEYGYQIGVDRVEPALVFEIDDIGCNELVWLHQYWGHVRFDDMQIKSVKYIEEV